MARARAARTAGLRPPGSQRRRRAKRAALKFVREDPHAASPTLADTLPTAGRPSSGADHGGRWAAGTLDPRGCFAPSRAVRARGAARRSTDLDLRPGRPDIAWPALRVAVFVDGAFWQVSSSRHRPGRSGACSDKRSRRMSRVIEGSKRELQELGWRRGSASWLLKCAATSTLSWERVTGTHPQRVSVAGLRTHWPSVGSIDGDPVKAGAIRGEAIAHATVPRDASAGPRLSAVSATDL